MKEEDIENEDDFEEDDFDIDKILNEDEDSPVEKEDGKKVIEPERKRLGKPKKTVKKEKVIEPSTEVALVNGELEGMEWQTYSQLAVDGFQNVKTGEFIDDKEALRRTLNYAQEAARNSR